MNIEDLINTHLSFIQTVWPMQHAIAVNPFWDCQQHDHITKTMREFYRKTGYIACQKLDTLFEQISSSAITSQNIKHAVTSTLENQRFGIDATHKETLIHSCFALIESLMSATNTKNQWLSLSHRPDAILVANQLHHHTLERQQSIQQTIKEDCLKLIAAFCNQNFPKTYFESDNFLVFWIETKSQLTSWRNLLCGFSQDCDQLIVELLMALGITQSQWSDYLFQIIWQLKGWMGHAKWHRDHPKQSIDNRYFAPQELIALWLAQELYFSNLCPNNSPVAVHTEVTITDQVSTHWKSMFPNSSLSIDYFEVVFMLQQALELSTLEDVKGKQLAHHRAASLPDKADVEPAQWVFCIDTRSEGMRRHIEHCGYNKTFGFAGFFGFPVQFQQKETNAKANHCPAILEPVFSVPIQSKKYFFRSLWIKIQECLTFHRKKPPYAFLLYEIYGMWFALINIMRCFVPTVLTDLKLLGNTQRHDEYDIPNDVIAEQPSFVAMAENALKGMSLTSNFSEIIVICGHESQSTNNPFQATLDCGACGGHSGLFSAIMACNVFNHPSIRSQLKQYGIFIPSTTQFVPACHNTTTDEITFYCDPQSLSQSQLDILKRCKANAQLASDALRLERISDLEGNRLPSRRAADWAEILPELALSNNHAMIIAPRDKTAKLDLKRRVFLHSYDYRQDTSGELLNNILHGPMVVAHWINMQYFFSTVCPEIFSSGNKATHNLTSHLGIMTGRHSDIQVGLPQQSLGTNNTTFHTPKRLLVLIDAPQNLIEALIRKSATLSWLVNGAWLSIEPLTD